MTFRGVAGKTKENRKMLNLSLFSPITDSNPKAAELPEQHKAAKELVDKTIGKQIWC